MPSSSPGRACTQAPGTPNLGLVFSRAVGDTTGINAAGTFTMQGAYGSFNAPEIITIASGATNSISIPSPNPDPNGALYWQAAIGSQGQQYEGDVTAIGSGTQALPRSTILHWPPQVTFMPRDAAYGQNADSQVGYIGDQDWVMRYTGT